MDDLRAMSPDTPEKSPGDRRTAARAERPKMRWAARKQDIAEVRWENGEADAANRSAEIPCIDRPSGPTSLAGMMYAFGWTLQRRRRRPGGRP